MTTGHHNDQRQIWISETHRDMLRELAADAGRFRRVVVERLIATAHKKLRQGARKEDLNANPRQARAVTPQGQG